MKKFGFIVLALLSFGSLALLPQVAKAQTALINPNGHVLDTATQAAAEGGKTAIVKGTAKTFNIVLKTTKISGTLTGSLQWQGSNNGTDFATFQTDTLTDQAGVKNYTYNEVDKRYLYYRALIVLGGTGSLSYAGTYYVTLPTISNVNN